MPKGLPSGPDAPPRATMAAPAIARAVHPRNHLDMRSENRGTAANAVTSGATVLMSCTSVTEVTCTAVNIVNWFTPNASPPQTPHRQLRQLRGHVVPPSRSATKVATPIVATPNQSRQNENTAPETPDAATNTGPDPYRTTPSAINQRGWRWATDCTRERCVSSAVGMRPRLPGLSRSATCPSLWRLSVSEPPWISTPSRPPS